MTAPLDYSGLSREELVQRLQALEQAEAERERLLHELEVHQIELEQQNQALRETQLALETSRDRYVQLFEFAPVGYLVLDPKGWIRQANRVASQMLGQEPGRLAGKFLSGFLMPGSADGFWLALSRQMQGGDFICPELELLGEGQTRAVHLECQPPLESEGVAGSLHLALVDITERRRKEAELQRLNRTLQAISRSHRALLHAEEEAELLAEICRIVVEDCGHALAWIGFAQDEPDRSVRVAAHAGDDQGYLGRLDISWADTARGRGPAGSALRNGRVAISRNLDSDPKFAPWREEARQRGFTAAVAIPLLEAGQAFGVLTIFSREQDPFSPAEVRLLGDLADDLVLGIRTLRLRADHARSEAELRDRENLLRTVAENTPDAIYVLDRAHRLRYFNPASLQLVRAYRHQPDLPLKALLGLEAREIFGDTGLARTWLDADEQAMASGQAMSVEDRIETGGVARVRLTVRTPLWDDAGQVSGLVGIARDITERKQAESERLAALEQQRDILVREVHHRIKNHLQGVIGLLRNMAAEHPELAASLEMAISQIRTIAQVYGLKSRGNDPCITLGQLVPSAGAFPGGRVPLVLRFSKDGADRELAQDEAVPIALVINELIANAFKHLDRADAKRPVRLSLAFEADGARLEVRGGPARLPPGFDFPRGVGIGTGLELVRALLPANGAKLAFHQQGDEVVAELVLTAPVLLRDR